METLFGVFGVGAMTNFGGGFEILVVRMLYRMRVRRSHSFMRAAKTVYLFISNGYNIGHLINDGAFKQSINDYRVNDDTTSLPHFRIKAYSQ